MGTGATEAKDGKGKAPDPGQDAEEGQGASIVAGILRKVSPGSHQASRETRGRLSAGHMRLHGL